MIKCKICNIKKDSLKGMKNHIRRNHNNEVPLKQKEYFDYILIDSVKDLNIYFKRIYENIKDFDSKILKICLNDLETKRIRMITIYLEKNIKVDNINDETIDRINSFLKFKENNLLNTASKEHYMYLYGKEIGLKKFKDYADSQRISGIDRKWFIKRYGEDEGNKRFNKIKKRQSKNSKGWINKSSYNYWIIRGYSEEDSKKLSRNSNPWCKDYYRIRGYSEEEIDLKMQRKNWASKNFSNPNNLNIDEVKKKLGFSIKNCKYNKIRRESKNSLEAFIKLYGEEIGNEKYNNFIKKVSKAASNQKRKRQSIVAINFFNDLSKILIEKYNANKEDIFYYTNGFEYKIGKYSVDFYYNGYIIEFYGDFWHANPRFYDEFYRNPIIKKVSFQIWEHDDFKINEIFLNKNYDIKDIYILWEHDCNHFYDIVINEILEEMKEYEII